MVRASGFSTSTCLPDANAARASSACICGGAQIATALSSASASNLSASEYRRAFGNWRAALSTRERSTSASAVTFIAGTKRRAGRWNCCAARPQPIIPRKIDLIRWWNRPSLPIILWQCLMFSGDLGLKKIPDRDPRRHHHGRLHSRDRNPPRRFDAAHGRFHFIRSSRRRGLHVARDR